MSEDSRSDLQKEMTRLQFEMAATNKPKINFCGLDEDIEDCDKPSENVLAKLHEKLAAKDEMLNEAAFEYHTKCEEMAKLVQENEKLMKQLVQTSDELTNVQVFSYTLSSFQLSNIFIPLFRVNWNRVIFS